MARGDCRRQCSKANRRTHRARLSDMTARPTENVERFGVRGDDQHPNHNVPDMRPLRNKTLPFAILGGMVGLPMLGKLSGGETAVDI